MGRVMGLDVGTKTIGISVSDELGLTAQGVAVIQRTALKRDISEIREWIGRYEVKEIVIGLPKNMDGSIGEMGQACLAFAQTLREKTGLPVHLWDERLSTRMSERLLLEADLSRKKRKQVIDKLAAVLILQSFLDSMRSKQ